MEVVFEKTYRYVVRHYGKGRHVRDIERAVYAPDGNLLHAERLHWKRMWVKTPLKRIQDWLESEESGYNRGYVPSYAGYPLREARRRFAMLVREFLKHRLLRLKCRYIRLQCLALEYYLSTFHHITTFRNEIEYPWEENKGDVKGSDAGVKDKSVCKEPTEKSV